MGSFLNLITSSGLSAFVFHISNNDQVLEGIGILLRQVFEVVEDTLATNSQQNIDSLC